MSSERKKPRAPSGLSAAGGNLWREVVAAWDLRPDELRILEEACREVELIRLMEDKLSEDGQQLVVTGSRGQPAPNPMLVELRQHRAVLRQLLAGLKLPDEDGQETSASAGGRSLALARWSRA